MKLLSGPSCRCGCILETRTCKSQSLECANFKFPQIDLSDVSGSGIRICREGDFFLLKLTLMCSTESWCFYACAYVQHILVFVTSFLPFSIIFIFMMHKSAHFEVSCCGISFPVKFHSSHLQNSQKDINLKKQTRKVLHSPREKCYVSQCHLPGYCACHKS